MNATTHPDVDWPWWAIVVAGLAVNAITWGWLVYRLVEASR